MGNDCGCRCKVCFTVYKNKLSSVLLIPMDKLFGSVFLPETGKHGPRLVGGNDRCSGRVEVLHGEHWGTLCDVYFGLEDASVVCEHLQCGVVEEIPRGAAFGKGNGTMWKENYSCRGNESRLWELGLGLGQSLTAHMEMTPVSSARVSP